MIDEAALESPGPLRPVAATAAHEQARLAARAGQTTWRGLLTVLGLRVRHLGSAEAATSGLRYQPVAWTVIAITAIAVLFPGRPEGAANRAVRAHAPIVQTPPPTSPPLTAPPSGTPRLDVPDFEFTYAPPPPVVVPAAPVPSSPTTTVPTPDVALTVRGFGWASSLSGTGISTSSVPEGTMPVGTRLGELDKVSFVRLAGTSTSLTLMEDAGGSREALGAGAVRACVITDPDWSEEPDQAMDDAPSIDTERCVDGLEDNDTWTFDLAAFADRTGQSGFALLPAEGAPADFQVTFKPR